MCLLRLEFEYVLRVVLPAVVDLSVQNLAHRLDADLEPALRARSVERHHWFFSYALEMYRSCGPRDGPLRAGAIHRSTGTARSRCPVRSACSVTSAADHSPSERVRVCENVQFVHSTFICEAVGSVMCAWSMGDRRFVHTVAGVSVGERWGLGGRVGNATGPERTPALPTHECTVGGWPDRVNPCNRVGFKACVGRVRDFPDHDLGRPRGRTVVVLTRTPEDTGTRAVRHGTPRGGPPSPSGWRRPAPLARHRTRPPGVARRTRSTGTRRRPPTAGASPP